MLSNLKLFLIISFINISFSFILLNQTRYSSDFFFDKEAAMVESQIFSYFNNIISTNDLQDISREILIKFIVYAAQFWTKTRLFPSSFFFDERLLKCVYKLYNITFQSKDDRKSFYTFFEATGKGMNDLGNEHYCKYILNKTLDANFEYYILQGNQESSENMTNWEDIYLVKLLNQRYFYIGICAPDVCTDSIKLILYNKEFKDFLYKYLSLSNFTLSVFGEKKNGNEFSAGYDNELLSIGKCLTYIFYITILIKVLFSFVKPFIMRKDYDRFYSDNYSQKDPIRVDSQEKIIEEEKDQEPEDKKLNKVKTSSSKKDGSNENDLRDFYLGSTYGLSLKEENNLYNPFHDNQDKYPFLLKLIKMFDLSDNVKLLTTISNKYYNSCGIKKIYFLKIIVMLMSISLKLIISQVEIPSKSFLVYDFYKRIFFILIKMCIFSPVFWIVLDAMTAGFKLMSFIKKKIYIENDFNIKSYSQFGLLIIPKIFLFILYYIFLHIFSRHIIYYLIDEHHLGPFILYDELIKNGTYSLRGNPSFGHHLKCMMPFYINYIDYFINDDPNRGILIEGNNEYYPYDTNTINYTYYKYDKTRYEIPSPFLTNTDLFINIYLNEFVLLIFMMVISYLSYKIGNKIFDIIILAINVILYIIPLFNLTKFDLGEKSKGKDEYSLLYILGQNFSEKYTHYFINFYYFGFLLGVMLFYHNEYNYNKISNKFEDSIIINSILSHNSSYESLSSNSENSYYFSFPFLFCRDIILFLNKFSLCIKRVIFFSSIIFILLISSTFNLFQLSGKYDETSEKLLKDEEITEDALIKIPNFSNKGVQFIFLYEKNLCCIFFFIFLMMIIVYPHNSIFIKFCNFNCFILFERISFSMFCTYNFFVNASFCFFYLDFKIIVTNIFLNSFGIFLLLLILNILFVCIFELPLRIIIKSWMNRYLNDNLKKNYLDGGLFDRSRRATIAYK